MEDYICQPLFNIFLKYKGYFSDDSKEKDINDSINDSIYPMNTLNYIEDNILGFKSVKKYEN